MNKKIIYDYDILENYERLKQNLSYVQAIKNSKSESRREYRTLAAQIGITKEALLDCLDSYEKNLLIEVYTSSEQLIKNFYYELIEMGNNGNNYLNKYFNKRLDPETFSPNVNFREIEKNVSGELIDNFKFTVSNKLDEVRIYNNIVKSRHAYAHRGHYTYNDLNCEGFSNVIEFIYYMSLELFLIVDSGVEKWIEYVTRINTLISLCDDAAKKINELNTYGSSKTKEERKKINKSIQEKIKSVKKECQKLSRLNNLPLKCIFFRPIYNLIQDCLEIDLRRKEDNFIMISKMNTLLKKYFVRK